MTQGQAGLPINEVPPNEQLINPDEQLIQYQDVNHDVGSPGAAGAAGHGLPDDNDQFDVPPVQGAAVEQQVAAPLSIPGVISKCMHCV